MTHESRQFSDEQIAAKAREIAQRPEWRAARRREHIFFGLFVVLLIFGSLTLRLLLRLL